MLFAAIEALLARQGVTLRDIDLFAGASGPGSFTGVRVGLSAIKGLAEVLGKRVVAVSNLEALAEFGTSDARATVIDAQARRSLTPPSTMTRGARSVPEVVGPLARFLTLLPEREIEWISQDPAPSPAQYGVVNAPRALAGAIARIAIRRAAAGRAQDPAAIEANYVRRSDAELLYKGD